MKAVKIRNEYVGYSEPNDEILVNPIVECEDENLVNIFKDLATKCGEYVYQYEYDGKRIRILHAYHTPKGACPMRIDHQWLDYDILQMSDWSKRKIIINDIP